jgi:hypothetical protein
VDLHRFPCEWIWNEVSAVRGAGLLTGIAAYLNRVLALSKSWPTLTWQTFLTLLYLVCDGLRESRSLFKAT